MASKPVVMIACLAMFYFLTIILLDNLQKKFKESIYLSLLEYKINYEIKIISKAIKI